MAHIALPQSPLAPGRSPVRIRIRDAGDPQHRAIVFLHSGWGYGIYPFDSQADAFGDRFRVVCPDRSGYGESTPVSTLAPDFHRRAADETLSVMDALGLEWPVLWGHSDGAIIALLLALASPGRVAGIVVEAAHYFKRKPASRAFFDTAVNDPASLGGGVAAVLERDHGGRWRDVIAMHARAWTQIADQARRPDEDFYDGRLPDVSVPVLVLHGARDPRTEPGELDALTAALRRRSAKTETRILGAGGHSPHSEQATANDVTAAASAFFSAAQLVRRASR